MSHVLQSVPGRPRTKLMFVFLVLLPAIVAYGILYRQALSRSLTQDDYGVAWPSRPTTNNCPA